MLSGCVARIPNSPSTAAIGSGFTPSDSASAVPLGVVIVTEEAARHLGRPLQGATVAIQGFGNVGSYLARFVQEDGATVVALSDSSGGVYNANAGTATGTLDLNAGTYTFNAGASVGGAVDSQGRALFPTRRVDEKRFRVEDDGI